MEKRIRVLTVIRHPVGGIRTYLKYTYGNLNRDQYQFTILTVDDEEGKLIEDDLKDLSVEVIRTRGQWRILGIIWNVFRLCGLSRVDVIHSQGLTAGMLALFGNWFGTVPHIITLHDVFREEQFQGWRGEVKKRILGMALNWADVIHCVGEDVRRNLLEFLPALAKKEGKCVVITNGIAMRRAGDGATDYRRVLRQELGLSQETVIFGFFGRFMPQKGFTYLIDAIEALAMERNGIGAFKVLAVNDGAFIREYKALIREKGLEEYFVFYGFTAEIDRLFLGVDAVVMPSLWEACPLVPMEALVLGCPVVATACIGLKEVLKDTPAVIIGQIRDPRAIVTALRHLMDNIDKIREQVVDFMPRAAELFDVTRTARELHELFSKVTRRNVAHL
ncbi:MAG: glycosyltransferase family 4 protein [Nitrospiraceae bacterium]